MRKGILLICFISTFSCLSNLSDEELKQTYQESIENQDWYKALDCVEEGLKRNPKDTILYFSKAFCLKNINPIKNHQKVIRNLNIYLDYYKTSSRGLLLKYISHFENNKYQKALNVVSDIENYYGISFNTLIMKANIQFLMEDYKNAAFNYEEATMFSLPVDTLKAYYYYRIYSKYFAGNKEGALWDTTFLDNRGLKEDNELLELIINDKLNIKDYNVMSFYKDVDDFQEEIRLKINLEYDRIYSPSYSKTLFYEPRYSLGDLKNLDENIELLNLSRANIDNLTNDIKRFKKLKALNLSSNKIKDFDKLFQQLSVLPNLEYLDLSYSNLKNFPSSISRLKQLKGLSLEASNIRKLPQEIGLLSNLSFLSLRNNVKFKDLPKEIRYLKNLNCLDVSGSGITRLRDELSYCYNLISVKANASKIEKLPEHIGYLKNLRSLNLGFNKIKELPNSIYQMSNLNDLSLGSNDIEYLPNNISKLDNLTTLSIEFNRFKEFPIDVLNLKNLRTLWVHNNNFTSIPIEVGKMKYLTHLLVDHEFISDENIKNIELINPKLNIIRNDCRRYVNGPKRKSLISD